MTSKRHGILGILGLVMAILAISATSASAAWTHLGGQPLFPGGIKGTGQAARNDFARKSRTPRFTMAMKTASLNRTARAAVKKAISHGQFTSCRLNYGDFFLREAFGVTGMFVDRNVTFRDPRYKHKGAPAFCSTVRVNLGHHKVKILHLKWAWKCVNFGLVSERIITISTPKPPKKPTAKPVPQPQPAPTPVPAPQPQPATPIPTTLPPTPPGPPSVEIETSVAHVYVNDNVWFYIKTMAAPGYSVALNVLASDGTVSDQQPSLTYDNQPCPQGWSCYRVRYQAPSYPVDQAYIDAIVVQNDPDQQTSLAESQFKVAEDDFGRSMKRDADSPTTVLPASAL